MNTLRQKISQKGYITNGSDMPAILQINAIEAVKEWLTEKREEKKLAARAWGCNAEHEKRTLDYLKEYELEELLKELEGNY